MFSSSMDLKDFVQTFRLHVFLSTLGGIYLPCSYKLFSFPQNIVKNILKTYPIVVALGIFIYAGDQFYGFLLIPMPAENAFFSFFAGSVYFYSGIRCIYMRKQHLQLSEILSTWENGFNNENDDMCLNIRRDLIKNIKIKLAKEYFLQFVIFVLPYLIMALHRVFFNHIVFNPSSLNTSIFEANAPLPLVLFQAFCVVNVTWSWLAYETFFILILSLIEQELTYLFKYLDFIMNTNPVNIRFINHHFRMWVKHHNQVIIFSRNVRKFYSPLLGISYLFIIAVFCGLLYSVDKIDKENAVYCVLSISSYSYMAFLACRIGDRIAEKSKRLTEAILFKSYWPVFLNRSMKNSLVVITAFCNKPITIDIKGYRPLNSQTYQWILLTQYRFFRFITDIK